MHETLKKTTAAQFAAGRRVNLEWPLALKDLIDGHLVQGHVDAVGTVIAVAKHGASLVYTVSIDASLRKYIAPRGAIALNGVSLTVAQKKSDTFTVALIPYTVRHTNLGGLKKGSNVNVEVDTVARYVVAALAKDGRVGRNAAKRKTDHKITRRVSTSGRHRPLELQQ